MKNKKKFSEQYLENLLNNIADIEQYYILKESTQDTGGLIHYLSSDSNLYILMEDNDDLVMACVEFLIRKDVPVFTNIDCLKQYETTLLEKI